jgi:hypothetical protein
VYLQPWYFIWVIIPAILIPHRQIRYVAFFFTYMASMIELVHTYIWPWSVALGGSSFSILNSCTYLLLFGLPVFLLLGQIRIRRRLSRSDRHKDGDRSSVGAIATSHQTLIPSTSPHDHMLGGA